MGLSAKSKTVGSGAWHYKESGNSLLLLDWECVWGGGQVVLGGNSLFLRHPPQ